MVPGGQRHTEPEAAQHILAVAQRSVTRSAERDPSRGTGAQAFAICSSLAPVSIAAAATPVEDAVATPLERRQVLWLTNASHLVNHMLGQMPAVLYPSMMAEFGFGVAELGVLVAIQNLVGNAAE